MSFFFHTGYFQEEQCWKFRNGKSENMECFVITAIQAIKKMFIVQKHIAIIYFYLRKLHYAKWLNVILYWHIFH